MHLLRFGILALVATRMWFVFWSLRSRFSGTHGDYKGQPLEFRIRRSRQKVDSVTIAVAVPDVVRFRLRPESAWDTFGKSLGIAREWQTDDPVFDQHVYIVSDDPVALQFFSDDVAFRRATAKFIAASGGTLCCSQGKLFIDVKNLNSDADEDRLRDVAAAKVLPALKILRDRIAALPAERWRLSRDPNDWIRIALTALTLSLGVAGLIATFRSGGSLTAPRQIVFHQTVLLALAVTVVMSALLHILVFALMRARSRTHLAWLDVLLIGIPGAWMVSQAQAIEMNLDDTSAGTEHYVAVTGQHTQRIKRSTSYYLSTAGWPDRRGDGDLSVTRAMYYDAHVGSCLRVVWHEGRLGDGWISAIETTRERCAPDAAH